MSTTTNLDTLKINYLTQAQYDTALENDEINENEIYLTPSDGSGGNTNSVELTQAEYDALTTEEKNNGTIYFITDGDPTPTLLADIFVSKVQPMVAFDTTATSGTDKEIYDALIALEWDSDVIV